MFEADATRWSNERLVERLRQSDRRIRMIGVHASLPMAYVLRAYNSGVSALVSYTSGLEALFHTVRAAALPVEAARTQRDVLTEREQQVLYLISAGYSPKEIAYELGISQHTVENHKQRIFTKLEVHNQAHAAASAVRLSLLPTTAPVAAVAGRRSGASVVLLDPTGAHTDRVRAILDEHCVPVLTGEASSPGDHEQPGPVTVLINEADADWKAGSGRPGELVVVAGGEPSHQEIAVALARGVTIIPAARIDDLLAAAVLAASQGYLLVNMNQVQALAGPSRPTLDGGWQRWKLALTPREKEILTSIGNGRTTKQTARELGISVRTVENLQSNLFRKLRVHSRAAAIAAARDLGLIED
ncbi:helix-turn-helix transcriptional regulator [Amycolatopsis anabasis]|uniref:helix-turn-helix transcriptional regulator n=1 Tax=Amycolatopsis anabasis TaxID=1840409 RepID=UPI002483A778|nr:LuxR family transcriptional regulator [Amycolatopsis anabasis]